MQPFEDKHQRVDDEEMAATMRKLDAQLVAVLERKPRVQVSEGFAAQVALQASALRVHVPIRTTRFGLVSVLVCAVLIAIAMLLLAPRTAGHQPFWMALQWLLCGQFCALTAWLAGMRQEPEK